MWDCSMLRNSEDLPRHRRLFLPPSTCPAGSIWGAHSSMPDVSDSIYSLQSCAPFPSRVAPSCRAKQQQQWLQLLWRQEKICRGLLAALVAAAAAQGAPEYWWAEAGGAQP